MSTTTAKSVFWQGIRDGSPFIFAAGPFAILFGVVATEAGFNLLEVMSMSILVIAGASQFTAVSQMQEAAPVLLIIAASLAVNLRMALYSAHLSPHFRGAPLWKRALVAYCLVDNAYAVSIKEFEERYDRPQPEKFVYYIACVIPVCIFWYGGTLLGAVVGELIPDSLPMDFALPLAFLGIVTPMVRTLPHLAAAITSIVLTLALTFLPYNFELLLAGLIAMIVGVQVERRLT